MVNVNKKEIKDDLLGEAWDKLWRESKKSDKDFKNKIRSLLSQSELFLFERRLLILMLLDKGLSYKEIGRVIDAPNSTISFIKKGFKRDKIVKTSAPFKKRKKRDYFFPAYKGSSRWAEINKYKTKKC